MIYRKYKRNTPTTTLIKNFVNKRSGKVVEARKEIQHRFECLDWCHQKKIVAAFLDSGKADREWVYPKMLNYWDPSFAPKVKELWEQYHEPTCDWVVIRYLPEEYLLEQMKKVEHFADGRNYYFLCRRLAKTDGFVIDRERLTPIDYLRLMYHLGWTPPDEAVLDCLFRTIHEATWDEYDRDVRWMYPTLKKRGDTYPVKKIPQFYPLSLYLWRDPLWVDNSKSVCNSTECKQRFDAWCEKVEQAIRNSDEFRKLTQMKVDDRVYERTNYDLLMKYCYFGLDERYRRNDVIKTSRFPGPTPVFNEIPVKKAIETFQGKDYQEAVTVFGDLMQENLPFANLVRDLDLVIHDYEDERR